MIYFFGFLVHFLALSDKEKHIQIKDGGNFREWLQNLPMAGGPQFRHILVHLLFPDEFERVFSGSDKKKICRCYQGLRDNNMNTENWGNTDIVLKLIRDRLEADRNFRDFYQEPFKSEWNNGNKSQTTDDGQLTSQNQSETLMEASEKPSPDVTSSENVIYFGPPGTGKTHTINKKRREYTADFASDDEWLKKELRDKNWYEVVFMALYLLEKATIAMLNEHKFIRNKPNRAEKKNIRTIIANELRWHSNPLETKFDPTTYIPPFVFTRESDGKSWILDGEFENECEDLMKLANQLEKGIPSQSDEKNKRYNFVTFHQSYSYEDFVEGIRPETANSSEGITYRVKPGVFREICQRAVEDEENHYALFIDEINRGNIAKIFGELITLIEPDKRLGAVNQITVTLPYSSEEFGVPPNLSIYGTMNSADRSIDMMDTALRRRFQFKEILPDSSEIKGSDENGNIYDKNGEKIELRKLLDTINERVEILRDRNFTIGHAYFMDVKDFDKLKEVFIDKLIPLLQEYFFDDWIKIQWIFCDNSLESDTTKTDHQIIRNKTKEPEKVFSSAMDHSFLEPKRIFLPVVEEDISPSAIRKIYENN